MPNYFYDLPEEIQSYIYRLAHLQEIRDVGAKRYIKRKLEEINELKQRHIRYETRRRLRIANLQSLISWNEGAYESYQLRYLESNYYL